MKEKQLPKKYVVLQPIIFVDTKGGNINIADNNSIVNNGNTCAFNNAGTIYYNKNCAIGTMHGENSGHVNFESIESTPEQLQLLQTQLQQLQTQMLQLQNQMQEICNNMYKLIN